MAGKSRTPALVGSSRGSDDRLAGQRDEPEHSQPTRPFQRLGAVAGALLCKVAREHGLSAGHALALADAGLAREAE